MLDDVVRVGAPCFWNMSRTLVFLAPRGQNAQQLFALGGTPHPTLLAERVRESSG